MRKVNECPNGIGLVSNFINSLGEKKKVIDFLIDFYIFNTHVKFCDNRILFTI